MHGYFDAEEIQRNVERQRCSQCIPLTQKYNRKMQFREKSKLPSRFHEKNFENYNAQSDLQKRALKIAKDYADNFKNNFEQGRGLVFFGMPGTGKTHLAAAIINKLCEHGVEVVYSSVFSAIREIKETYRQDSENTERKVLEKYKEIKFLVFDEIGKQYGTPAEKIILFEILNIRYEEIFPTILISNCTYEELNLFLGEATVDRLHETSQFVPFAWESHRKLIGQENK